MNTNSYSAIVSTRWPAGPLNPADWEAVQAAVGLRKPIYRAAGVAFGSAVTTLLIGFFAGLFVVLSPSLSSLWVTAGLLAVGIVEYIGYLRLRRADPSAPRWLALNQLAFVGILWVYSILAMVTYPFEEMRQTLSTTTEVARIMPTMGRLLQQWSTILLYAVYAFYILLMLLSLGFQGGLALYYWTRRKSLTRYRQQTPEWTQHILLLTNG